MEMCTYCTKKDALRPIWKNQWNNHSGGVNVWLEGSKSSSLPHCVQLEVVDQIAWSCGFWCTS